MVRFKPPTNTVPPSGTVTVVLILVTLSTGNSTLRLVRLRVRFLNREGNLTASVGSISRITYFRSWLTVGRTWRIEPEFKIPITGLITRLVDFGVLDVSLLVDHQRVRNLSVERRHARGIELLELLLLRVRFQDCLENVVVEDIVLKREATFRSQLERSDLTTQWLGERIEDRRSNVGLTLSIDEFVTGRNLRPVSIDVIDRVREVGGKRITKINPDRLQKVIL